MAKRKVDEIETLSQRKLAPKRRLVPKKHRFFSFFPMEIWWFLVRYLTEETYEGAPTIPQVCKGWNEWYKAFEKERFVQFVSGEYGLQVISFFFTIQCCVETPFKYFEAKSSAIGSGVVKYCFDEVFSFETQKKMDTPKKWLYPLPEPDMVCNMNALLEAFGGWRVYLKLMDCGPVVESDDEEIKEIHKNVYPPKTHLLWDLVPKLDSALKINVTLILDSARWEQGILNKLFDIMKEHNKTFKFW